MRILAKTLTLLIMIIAIGFSACDGGGGGDGGGSTETPPSSLFVNRTYIAPGAICAAGGIQIDMGFDSNYNNVLDADEITNTEYVCNGEDASSHPFVVYTSPTPNETDVKPSNVINAVFNTDMDEDTVDDTTFTVYDEDNNAVTGTVTCSGIVAHFQPAAGLAVNTKYRVTLSSSIENNRDIEMGYDHAFYFTTGKADILYMANGAESGSVPVDSARYDTGDSVTIPDNSGGLVKGGYIFTGWNTKADGTGTTYSPGGTVTIGTTSLILYAVWSELHRVTYNGNGADGGDVPVDSNEYIYDQSVTVLGNSEGLTNGTDIFTGWNTEADGSGTNYEPGDSFNIGTANVILYARWISNLFMEAVNVGDVVAVTVGSETIKMIYANNQASITFPYSPEWTLVNDEKATLTKKIFMSETEVTNALMVEVLQWAYDNGKFSSNIDDHNGLNETMAKHGGQILLYFAVNFYGIDASRINYSEGSFSVDPGYENHPVVFITWYGAVMSCNWLTEMRDGTMDNLVYTNIDIDWQVDETIADDSKNGYRLPAREEWEHAARYIGTTAPTIGALASEYIARNVNSGHADLTPGYYWTPCDYASGATDHAYFWNEQIVNSDLAPTRLVGWFSGDTDMGVSDKLMPVGLKEPNQLGLRDMSGNVWEWCFGLGGNNHYSFYCGGSWDMSAYSMMLAFTPQIDPVTGGECRAEYYNQHVGFRIVRTR